MLLFYLPGACSLAEIIALEWTGKPYKLCRVAAEERQHPAYLALNPQGAVPVLRLRDRVLSESAALLLHIADTNPTARLAPAVATPERDTLHQWLSYLSTTFHTTHYPIFKPQRYTSDPSQHEALAAMARTRVLGELRYLDRSLAGRSYALDSGRSVVDAYIAAMARWGRRYFDYAQEVPEVDRYLTGLDEDPALRRAKAIESGEIEGPDGAFEGHVAFEQATAR